jgi:hypothetical protein
MVLLRQLRVTPSESVLELPEVPKPKPQPLGALVSTPELTTVPSASVTVHIGSRWTNKTRSGRTVAAASSGRPHVAQRGAAAGRGRFCPARYHRIAGTSWRNPKPEVRSRTLWTRAAIAAAVSNDGRRSRARYAKAAGRTMRAKKAIEVRTVPSSLVMLATDMPSAIAAPATIPIHVNLRPALMS